MATKLYIIGNTVPNRTTGADVVKGAPLSPSEIDQNFINLRAAIDRIVGEAASDAEQTALENDGYRFIVRTDKMAGYVPVSLPPAATITMQLIGPLLPTSTIIMTRA